MAILTGFERDFEAPDDSRFCLAVKGYYADQLHAEGKIGIEWIPELQRREAQVYSGEVRCPLANTCKKYPGDMVKRQLSLFEAMS